MRVVFLGSPDFALPTLRNLTQSEHDLAGVITQPDRRAGRGRTLRRPAVKDLAQSLGVPVLQPASVNAKESLDWVRDCTPDALVIAAFGQILRQPLLDIPKLGSLNVHASLLPKYRGAAPVAAAILAGEQVTGVTIMEVVLALDAGPVVAQREVAIGPQETTGTLTSRLAEAGADLLIETLGPWSRGDVTKQPQDESQATYAKPIRREDAVIDWSLPARDIWLRVRAYNPWPAATTTVDGEPLRILEALPLEHVHDAAVGTVVPLPAGADGRPGAGFAVVCGHGLLAVVEAQRPGRRALSGEELLRGWPSLLSRRLGS
jgi:methionyl-tRNA formyltransferase